MLYINLKYWHNNSVCLKLLQHVHFAKFHHSLNLPGWLNTVNIFLSYQPCERLPKTFNSFEKQN